MMIVMKPNATQEEIEHVLARVRSVGARAHVSKGEEVTVIGATALDRSPASVRRRYIG